MKNSRFSEILHPLIIRTNFQVQIKSQPLSFGYFSKAIKLLKLSFAVTDIHVRTLKYIFSFFFVINDGANFCLD